MLRFLRSLFTLRYPADQPPTGGWLQKESRFFVTLDDQRVVCRHPSGLEETVAWDELDVVLIETKDTGPLGTDVFWVLVGRDAKSGCVVPQGATGETQLLEAVQRLPGFDNAQLIAAMACTDNRTFLCWRRPAGASA